jgi:hypothetical protein
MIQRQLLAATIKEGHLAKGCEEAFWREARCRREAVHPTDRAAAATNAAAARQAAEEDFRAFRGHVHAAQRRRDQEAGDQDAGVRRRSLDRPVEDGAYADPHYFAPLRRCGIPHS